MAAGHGNEIMIKDTLVFLFAAGVAVPIFRFIRLPAIVGFMISGIALGPFALGALSEQFPILEYISISDPAAAAPFAELGVLFLLFLLGLEFSFEKLWGLKRIVFGAGGIHAAISTIVIASVAWVLNPDPVFAIVCGLALALSSTAIVMQLLVDNKDATRPVGRSTFGILLFQDILVAPILIFVGLVDIEAGESLSGVLVGALVQGLIAIGVIFVIGRFALRRIFRMVASAGGRDFLMALTLLTLVGASAITASADLSLALGAFLAGLLLGETEFKHQAEVDLEPFKGLLLGLFFMTVGMGLDLPAIAANPHYIIFGLVLLLLIKLIAGFVATRLMTGSTTIAIESSFYLAPAGEFAFVVTAAASAAGILPANITAMLAAIAGISMLITPAMAMAGRRVSARFKADSDTDKVEEIVDFSTHTGHVVIAGFGRVGTVVARMLIEEGVDIVALDRNMRHITNARKEGLRAYLGDASRPEMLASVGLEGASAFIVTVDNPAIVETMVRSVRSVRPDIPILARAHDQGHAGSLEIAGADYVVPEVVETGLQLAGQTLRKYGYDYETVRSLLAAERDREYHSADPDADEHKHETTA
ncbi:MAG: portal protein [Ponticaulis sp.]|nr:portal protein [Ponticaulis sp.]|tara:strand:- start:29039 stop:30811 length:1773 start_codon:yes stop_codon:yes gene_type:complete